MVVQALCCFSKGKLLLTLSRMMISPSSGSKPAPIGGMPADCVLLSCLSCLLGWHVTPSLIIARLVAGITDDIPPKKSQIGTYTCGSTLKLAFHPRRYLAAVNLPEYSLTSLLVYDKYT